VLTLHGDAAATDHGLMLVVRADGDTFDLEQAAAILHSLTPRFDAGSKYGVPDTLVTHLTWPACVQLSYSFGPAWRPSPSLSAWIGEQAELRMVPPTADELAFVPAGDLTPYAHQTAGAALIKATGRVLLADDPGTGKTITALLGLTELWIDHALHGRETPEPILVVCPASVVDPWVQAVRTWTPHWSVTPYRGPRRQNLLGGFDVYVTSYDVARMDAPTGRRGPLNRLAPQAVVVDECHYIKNPGAERTQAIVRIARDAPYVIGASGTPITHHTGDLCPMLEAMDAAAWPSGERFKSRFLLTDDGSGYAKKVTGLNPAAEPEFRACLEGQLRRVAKADVLDLPPKVYSIRTVEMPSTWRKAYDDFEAQMYAELPGHDGQPGAELAVMDVFTVLTHLKALACAPADVRIETELVLDEDPDSPTFGEEVEKRHIHLDLKHPSWKVNELLHVLEERPHQSVLTFAPSKQLVMLAGESAERAGRRVGYIVGGQTPRQRTAVVDAFQAGQLDAVFATTGAGGVGLTLTAAQTVVFLQRPLSLVEATQAEDRAHRIGQTGSVEIIDIITKNTVDDRIRSILRAHAGQLAELVRDPRIVAELMGGRNVQRAEGAAA
jgi:SNF2 family DNA or RNA helicase